MKNSLLYGTAFCQSILVPLEATAQAPTATAPLKILSIFREDIKAGPGAAHENLETGYVRVYVKRNNKWQAVSTRATRVVSG